MVVRAVLIRRALDYLQATGCNEVERATAGSIEWQERFFVENNRFQLGAQTFEAGPVDVPHERAVRNYLNRVQADVHADR